MKVYVINYKAPGRGIYGIAFADKAVAYSKMEELAETGKKKILVVMPKSFLKKHEVSIVKDGNKIFVNYDIGFYEFELVELTMESAH